MDHHSKRSFPTPTYDIGTPVFAKLGDFPFWPAVVTVSESADIEMLKKQVMVRFWNHREV